MSEFTFEDIEKYTKQLISRKLASPDSLKQLIFAVNFLYNTELNRNFKFHNIRIPEAKRKEKDYLTQEEVIRLIDFIPHKKQKAIITTIYACFLERKEVLNLKVGDVDSVNKLIYVRSDNADPTRECILSDKHLKILRNYFKSVDPKPKVYLFEGQTPHSGVGAVSFFGFSFRSSMSFGQERCPEICSATFTNRCDALKGRLR